MPEIYKNINKAGSGDYEKNHKIIHYVHGRTYNINVFFYKLQKMTD